MPQTVSIEAAAQIAHEANRTYCLGLGDTSQPLWEYAPDWQKSSAITGVEFHLKHLSDGSTPPPSASHDSWLEQKRAEGWQYGPTKDPVAKLHPCFVPYEALPLEQRAKDYLFGAIVKSLFDAGVLA